MRGQFHEQRWVEAKNVGSTPVIPFGLVVISEADWENPDRTVLHVKRPTKADDSPLAINSFKPIAVGDYGLVSIDGPAWVRYNTTYTPAIGEAWGANTDSFWATKGKSGLIILGGVDTLRSIVLVEFGMTLGLRGGCLAENHPRRGNRFSIYLGSWSSASNKWIYTGTTAHAIDWRYGVPYPTAGATGLFEARASDTYGTIWEAVALDCDSPGACGS